MPRDLFKKRVMKEKNEAEILVEKIDSAKTDKELLKLLLSLNDSKYAEVVLLLESVVYNGKSVSLGKIKGML